ncbi:hypothetical protein AMTRI_Chr04g252320 [Amborella trichopoda]
MGSSKGVVFQIVRVFWPLLLLTWAHHAWGNLGYYNFTVESSPYTRLCRTKVILTVNGQYPGPTLYVRKGGTLIVKVLNKSSYNITLHWHGVKQPRNPWYDGPAYITQCPIKPGGRFTYKVFFSAEEGTVWWHAHSDWSRATVHGAIVVYPRIGASYPFPKPDGEMPIIFGEWWKKDVMQVLREAVITGGDPNISDAFNINGQPGDLYPCSRSGTFRMFVEQGKTYLLRLVNCAMNDELFYSVANHTLTVVGMDGSYLKPFATNFIVITPGQTMDVLLTANQPRNLYYMAARSYSSGQGVAFDNTTTTAILQYANTKNTSVPIFATLPYYNDTSSATSFTLKLKSLASKDHPISVPTNIDDSLVITVSVNTIPCVNNSCQGPNGSRLAASLNNISFQNPSFDILQAYYARVSGVFTKDFPSMPPFVFNFTADSFPESLQIPELGTKVRFLEWNSNVQIVFQGTNLVAGENHPFHVHGHSVYVVGQGFGNYDAVKDPLSFNLLDPPNLNTVDVPVRGWAAVRFKANNPGVWFLHCHLERHLTWGMNTVFITKNGPSLSDRLLPPPPDLPSC